MDELLRSLSHLTPPAPGLRVAVICLHTSPTATLGHSANGGLNVYVREVCACLARLGIATDVFTRQTAEAGLQVEALGPLSRVIYLPAGRPGLDKYRLLDEVPAFAGLVEEHMARGRQTYHMLYSHYWLSGLVACSLRGRLRLPWAHTAHTLALVKNRSLAPGDVPEPEVRSDLEGEISRCADLLVVSTEAEGDALRSAYHVRPDRVAVIAPGVDSAAFPPRDRQAARELLGHPAERLFVFVGRLERLKGVDVVLRALAQIRGRHPEARLLVLGEDSGSGGGGERRRLERLAAELGIEGRVDFVGSVAQERLAAYYAAADACLMPSYTESFGLVGLEAQACGTPVIASNVAGLASIVREGANGFLVDGPDPDAYAARMELLLDRPELTEAMGTRARRQAARFTWSRTAGQLAARFQDLVSAQVGVQPSWAHE